MCGWPSFPHRFRSGLGSIWEQAGETVWNYGEQRVFPTASSVCDPQVTGVAAPRAAPDTAPARPLLARPGQQVEVLDRRLASSYFSRGRLSGPESLTRLCCCRRDWRTRTTKPRTFFETAPHLHCIQNTLVEALCVFKRFYGSNDRLQDIDIIIRRNTFTNPANHL